MCKQCAVLSKLSGFTVIILLVILFPITTKDYEKWAKYVLLAILTLFFARKAAYDTFIGTGLVIIAISIGLGLQLRKIKSKNIESYSNLKPYTKGFLLTVTTYSISLIVWIQHMLQFP